MKSMAQPYRFLGLFLSLNIAFQLISDATAGKIITVAGQGISVTVLYFPFTYLLADIITEVYGYAQARTILWYTLFASIIAGIFYQIAILVPAAPFFKHGDAYDIVFGVVPRVLVGGWLAVFSGEISNNYVMAKMKILTNGRFLWTRTIGSTIIGEGVNTAVFYVVALGGVLPTDQLFGGIFAGWIIKTLVETIMTPVTYIVINYLKKAEGVDYYDRGTNFSPFIVEPIQLPASQEPVTAKNK